MENFEQKPLTLHRMIELVHHKIMAKFIPTNIICFHYYYMIKMSLMRGVNFITTVCKLYTSKDTGKT